MLKLQSHVAVFGARASKEVRLNEVIGWGPDIAALVPL